MRCRLTVVVFCGCTEHRQWVPQLASRSAEKGLANIVAGLGLHVNILNMFWHARTVSSGSGRDTKEGCPVRVGRIAHETAPVARPAMLPSWVLGCGRSARPPDADYTTAYGNNAKTPDKVPGNPWLMCREVGCRWRMEGLHCNSVGRSTRPTRAGMNSSSRCSGNGRDSQQKKGAA